MAHSTAQKKKLGNKSSLFSNDLTLFGNDLEPNLLKNVDIIIFQVLLR